MRDLPTGTVSFLFTDIEGSTRLLQELGDDWAQVVRDHHRLMREAFAAANGREVDTQGDAFFAVFGRARDAIDAAIACQRALAAHEWPREATIRARVGIHTGEPRLEEEGYLGVDVVRASRVCAAGHGGQVVITASTRELVRGNEPEDVEIRDLGEHALKGLDRPERLFELVVSGLPAEHPALRAEPAGTAGVLGSDWRRQLDGALAALSAVPGPAWEKQLERALDQLGAKVERGAGTPRTSRTPARALTVFGLALTVIVLLAAVGVVAIVVWLVELLY